jgi:hypothetical protein
VDEARLRFGGNEGMAEMLVQLRRSMMTGGRVGFVALTSLLLSSAFDPSFAVSSATQRSCKSDYKKLCPSYKLGSSELRYCMESQARSISGTCIRAAVDNGDLSRSKARSLGHY